MALETSKSKCVSGQVEREAVCPETLAYEFRSSKVGKWEMLLYILRKPQLLHKITTL